MDNDGGWGTSGEVAGGTIAIRSIVRHGGNGSRRPCMEPSSHLSVILDLSPLQWHFSSLPNDNPYPLTFRSFLAQTLAFLNSHLAFKHENTLAVYGALPGKRYIATNDCDYVPDLFDDPVDCKVSCCTLPQTNFWIMQMNWLMQAHISRSRRWIH